ncbi:MAG TPA: hypothetical protein VK894_00565 [Jiangellales bacterium]|nr:hypothetical protein [Jiangellales bacterium]
MTGSTGSSARSAATDANADRPVLAGCWAFREGAGTTVADASGNGHPLTADRDLPWVPDGAVGSAVDGGAGGAVALDGAELELSTAGPVLRTDRSLSVAAWVRLDPGTMGGKADLPPGQYAIAAVSQEGESHSALYLGARKVAEGQTAGTPEAPLRWDFTVSPVDGSVTGTIEWPHAASAPIEVAALGDWVFLAGVYDLAAGTVSLILPATGQTVTATLPAGWTNWHAEGGFVVGRARYLHRPSDRWLGSLGPVWAFSGVLTADDAAALYRDGALPAG